MWMSSWIRRPLPRSGHHTIRKALRRVSLVVEGLEARDCPSTFTVDNTLDDGSAGSLRWAVGQANTHAGADTIAFDGTAFDTAKTITLGGTQLRLSDTTGATTITGPAAGVTVSGNNLSRVFQVDAGVTASLSGLTITGGKATSANPAFSNGGGLLNSGTTTLTSCTVSGNAATRGGGVFNYGVLNLTGCTLSGNTAQGRYAFDRGQGGAVFNNYGSTANLTGCTLSGNSALAAPGSTRMDGGDGIATGAGGGVFNRGNASLTNCTLSGNSAFVRGGGIYNGYAPSGGSYPRGTAWMTNCTVSGNQAFQGGGLWNRSREPWQDHSYDTYGAAPFMLGNTLVAGNFITPNPGLPPGRGPDAFGPFFSQGHNLILRREASSGIDFGDAYFYTGILPGWLDSDLVGIDPLLGPLGSYGGPTETMYLKPGSPASHAGAGVISGMNVPTTDQRGLAWWNANAPDIGAYGRFAGEPFQTYVVNTTSDTLDPGPGLTSLREAVELANDDGVPSTITFNTTDLGTPGSTNFTTSQTITRADELGLDFSATSSVGSGTAYFYQVVAETLNGMVKVSPELGAAGNTATLTWNAVPGAFKYIIYRRANNSGYVLLPSVVSGQTLSFTDSDPLHLQRSAPGSAYFYQVVAETATGQVASAEAGASTNFLNLTWNAVPGATSYGVYRRASGDSYGLIGQVVGVTSFQDAGRSTSNIPSAPHAWLDLSDTTSLDTITGPAAGVTIDGGNRGQVFQIDVGANASISGLTISGATRGTDLRGNNLPGSALTVQPNAVLTLYASTLYDNAGPAVLVKGTATLTNSTVSGSSGNGISVGSGSISGTAELINSTVSGNTFGLVVNRGSVTLLNTIVARNNDGSTPDVAAGPLGTIHSLGNNLIGTADGSSGWVASDLTGTVASPLDPLLGSLADNGGPTRTMALLPGSPALNAGSAAGAPSTDQRGFARNGNVDIGAFELQSLNQRPVIANQTFSLPENRPDLSAVDSVFATDPDVGQQLTYAITGGNTNNAFAIDPTTGALRVNNSTALDYETTSTFTLTVMVTDNGVPNLSAAATITVNLTDVNETPYLNGQTFNLAENSAAGTQVGFVVGSDPDVGQKLTYSIIAGNTNSAFAIDPANGRLTVANSAALDYEATPGFTLTVQAMDNGSPNRSITAQVVINLQDVVESATGTDVTSRIALTRGGYKYNRTTSLWDQAITLKNSSTSSIAGTIQFVLENLTPGVTLAVSADYVVTTPGAGRYVVTIPKSKLAALAAGQRYQFNLLFSNPLNKTISYDWKVFVDTTS